MMDTDALIREEPTPEELLLKGKAPGKGELLWQITSGADFLTDFWDEKYLQEYIRAGGSKIKFVAGRTGSGKSHFLQMFSQRAEEQNYKTAEFSASEVWLHDFKEIYLEIFRQCDIMDCLKGCADRVIEGMGFSCEEIPEHMTFMDYLASQDMGDALTRREIRMQLKQMFLDNPFLDNNFALACSLLTGSILGHPILEQQNKELLLGWLMGDRTVKLTLLRALGLSPSRISKYNARHMLRSLAEVIRLGGWSGMVVVIDDMEILLNRTPLCPLHYTKMRREDTYESIRQLIDEIDSLRNIMFVFAFDRALMDDENAGVKSYQALWMRIQNEIVGQHFNRFADIVDLDRMAAQVYTPQVLEDMWARMAEVLTHLGVTAVSPDPETIRDILERSGLGGVGIPRLVLEAARGTVDGAAGSAAADVGGGGADV